MTLRVLDTYCEVVTPEGVGLHLPAAGPMPRALAWLIDLIARWSILLVMLFLLGTLGAMGGGLGLIVLFLVYWGYPILMEGLWNGQTLGKRALRLQVISANGAPVGWMAVIVRNLLRTVDMLPIGYAVGLVTCLFDNSGRRLGDMVAGTLVIHTMPRVEMANMPGLASAAP
ncbi:MAG: RDD family protein, partial [Xanthomonadaceae bacterium]|nr:RDD family protein [Xanthomonadaceae bacterium]